MPRPWRKVGSRQVGDYRIFNIRADRKISPRTEREHEFFIIECVNWVNVVALTPDRQIILVKQYRHGSNTVELEVPGGLMESHDTSPESTGQRELREETGYEGDRATIIGSVYPNPAIMNNICFTVLVENCRLVHPVQFDHCEDLVTELAPLSELPAMVANGTIRHSLVIAALYHFDLCQRKRQSETGVL